MNNLSLIKKVHREKGPLESHALEDFVFSGVLIQGGYVEAIFITPDGLFYRGKVGDYIGKKEGRITKIDPMGIVEVTQPKITISGKKSEDKIILDNTRPVFED